MRALFWLLAIAALAIGVAMLGRLTDGYVLWVVPPWRAELSLNLFVILQLFALAGAYLLLRVLFITLHMPSVVAAFRARRARQRDERNAGDALRLFWEGRYSQSLKSAEKVGSHELSPKVGAGRTATAAQGVAALVALKAAYAVRDPARIAEWQARAVAMDADGWGVARLMAELRIALDARDWGAAQAALDQLGPKERRQISIQRLALRLAQGKGEWAEVLRLARQLEKHRALTHEQARPLRARAYQGMLDNLQGDATQLGRFWESVPGADRLDLPLAQRMAVALAAAGACKESARLIEDYLDERWDSPLLDSYADCPGGDALGRIAHAEKWLHEHPDDARLLLALGRLCVQRQLWGKAQSYFEAAQAVSPSCAGHIELARLCDQLERSEEANRHYRAAANCQAALPQIQSRGGRKSV